MAWNDRLIEAAYESPGGTRIVFDYENVSKSFDKKTTAFNFPDANGTYIQDMGHSGRRYPLRIFFWGDDYDLQAIAFEAALQERGTGKLEHPIYGIVNVVPFGTVSQRDDLKTASNQAIIEVVFWETIGLIYPASQTDPASSVLSAVNEYKDAAAAEFKDITDLDSAVEQASFKNSYTALLDNVKSGLQSIADVQDDVQKQFNAINDSINNGIDILISDPLTLAFQTVILIQTPARALTNITARINAYKNLADSILSKNTATPGNDSRNANEFYTDDLYASTYVTGSIVSVINNQFVTKTEAFEAAEAILLQFENLITWRDDNYESLGAIDIGSAYQQLQEAVALTAGFLVEISFTLKQERRLILDRARTIIDLVAELYGSIDDQLDFFITSNDLSGSEILELPKGREIVYYI
jgi:prophage DNA circulation protein